MFSGEIEEIKLLNDSFQAISNLISEGIFQLDEDGIKLTAADPAMVALVDFKISKDAFSSYEIGEEQKLGLSIERLYSILRRASAGEKLRLETDEEKNKLNVTLEDGATRKFSLPLLSLDEDDIPSKGDLDFSIRANLDVSALSKGIGDAAIVGDSLTISADGEEILIESEGDSSGVRFKLEKNSESLLDLNVLKGEGRVKSIFSLDYLNKVIKAKKLSDTVTLQLGDDFPLKIDFKVPDKLELSFILAPRIEEE